MKDRGGKKKQRRRLPEFACLVEGSRYGLLLKKLNLSKQFIRAAAQKDLSQHTCRISRDSLGQMHESFENFLEQTDKDVYRSHAGHACHEKPDHCPV